MIFYSRLQALLQSLYSILAPGIDLGVENIALRQQLVAFKKEKPRPKLTGSTGFSGYGCAAYGNIGPARS